MGEPDVAAEINDWLEQWEPAPGREHPPWPDPLMRRARDEIVALREQLATMRHAFDDMEPSLRSAVAESVRVAQKRIRAEALEEAARLCERFNHHRTAQEIRALKDERHE